MIFKAIETALSEVTERQVSGLTPETELDKAFDLDSYMFVQFLLALEDQIEGLQFDPDAIGQQEFNRAASLVSHIEDRIGARQVEHV
ncbi:phosphopantetheine-binding protein [Phaeobacter gallaeciensis]|uniref:Phosphopantetheine attachment site n=1 Tax=Phaeobacter gallaeciensis TaxID=60890 RepID=A0AAC9Z951_9RHOB|nr:phosphopantetheine-binding protein [Phaeobacter gallaeciensis]AHD09791.1 Phosphopantetheine attachment site [Phaeobacter gallaeciensis DSM 26640]ATE93055.1 Phosphopantetheine attachment site [Phaeobacter gallaeciensis]ATE97123.1 Phosphopantetheine attachment site [Phaeobacter gallaeciensis]ATF01720.1 Phosphopantetheine attachment site [Phaeobacter gallaeciensis]ATF06100.1 Phosphopantetheine attachment site [Phaeobacter gallaeciensis]